jgi:hypothetical protein
MKRLCFLLFCLLITAPLFATPRADVTATVAGNAVVFAWDPNTEPDLAGYNVYQGTHTGGPYTKIGSVGVMATPTFTVTLSNNGTYYFVVSAFNLGGLESGYSNEVSKIIAVGPANPKNLRIPTGIAEKPLIDLFWGLF